MYRVYIAIFGVYEAIESLGLINKVYRATKRWDLRQALDHILSSHPQPAHHHSWATDHTGRV